MMAGAPSSKDDNSQKDLGIGGLNVRSLLAEKKNKMQEVKALIEKFNLDIFVLGESWLPGGCRTRGELEKRLHIEGFKYERADRKFDSHGGLIVYFRENISYTTKSPWEDENKVQCLEISVTSPTKFHLVAIYNPPRPKGSADAVIKKMKTILETQNLQETPVMFIGDLNIDPDRQQDARVGRVLNDLDTEFSTRRLITSPTRNQYCIDHIITNIPERLMVQVISNVIATSEKSNEDSFDSDHNLVLCRIIIRKTGAFESKYSKEKDLNPYSCHICERVFANNRGLHTHIVKIHEEKITNDVGLKATKNKDVSPRAVKPVDLQQRSGSKAKHSTSGLTCPICDQNFKNELEVSNHFERAHDLSNHDQIRGLEVASGDFANEKVNQQYSLKQEVATSGLIHEICSKIYGSETEINADYSRTDSQSNEQQYGTFESDSDKLWDIKKYQKTRLKQKAATPGASCHYCGKVCKNEKGVQIHIGKMHKK